MAEGSISEFTLWLGPIPVRWQAVHSNVGPNGFTDTQISGPLKYWRHTHRFDSVSENSTQIDEHIEYEHISGWRGLLSGLLFGYPGLMALFAYRRFATCWALRQGDRHDS
jgi:ligand-binding SRPBCC domain-containing protein